MGVELLTEPASSTASVDTARAVLATLPRAYEAIVRDRVKFRVGRIVFVAFSSDERIMGFAFPRDERDALVAGDPDRFLMPSQRDLRYQWVCVRLATLSVEELRELIIDAWRMCVPKFISAAFDVDESAAH